MKALKVPLLLLSMTLSLQLHAQPSAAPCGVIGRCGNVTLIRNMRSGETVFAQGEAADKLSVGNILKSLEPPNGDLIKGVLASAGSATSVSLQQAKSPLASAQSAGATIVGFVPVDSFDPVDGLRCLNILEAGAGGKAPGGSNVEPVDSLKSLGLSSFDPVDSARFLGIDKFDPVDSSRGVLVTCKVTATGETFSFTAPALFQQKLAVGQAVGRDDAGKWAFFESASLGDASVTSYSYPTGGTGQSSGNPWVFEPIPGGTTMGTLLIVLPKTDNMRLQVGFNEPGKPEKHDYVKEKGSWSLFPGDYAIKLTGIPFKIPIKAGTTTRMLMGVLSADLGSQTRIDLLGSDGKSVDFKYGKVCWGLPVGRYDVEVGGRTIKVEIKEGQITKL